MSYCQYYRLTPFTICVASNPAVLQSLGAINNNSTMVLKGLQVVTVTRGACKNQLSIEIRLKLEGQLEIAGFKNVP